MFMVVKYEDKHGSVQNTEFMKVRYGQCDSSLKGGQRIIL